MVKEEDVLWASLSVGPLIEEISNSGPSLELGPSEINGPSQPVFENRALTSTSTSSPATSTSSTPTSTHATATLPETSSNSPDTTTAVLPPPVIPIPPVNSRPTTTAQAVAPTVAPPPKRSQVYSRRKEARPQQNPASLPQQSKRKRELPVTLKDYVVNQALCEELGSTSENVPHPISKQDSVKGFSVSHIAYVTAIMTAKEPRSYKQAMSDDRWKMAMGTEIDAQEENHTWTIEDLPPGKRAIGSQWVYKVKHNSDGTVERYKARLVALGNKQKEGEDYGETFAPVAKMGTVRLFLDVAAKHNWEIHQMDVYNAFLHGELKEEVYMRLPPGFEASHPNKVCRLRKSLYGLKQAPRCWFEKLTTALKKYGFRQSLADYSLFTMVKARVRINILIYVDDLIITGSSPQATQEFKNYLASCFKMKDLGPLKYFLGIEVARNAEGIYICQRKYALDIISETGMLEAKPATFPLEQNHQLALSTSPLLTDPQRYRRLIGRLIYLGVTQPDLAFSVHILAQFMQSPREAHWEVALRIVRYLKAYPGQGILLRREGDFQITGWCDSDYASCPLTRRSVTGYIVQLRDSPISWKTKKQPTVSKSSAEAEYRAMSFLTSELKWLKQLLFTLGIRHDQPMTMCCDSKSAIYIATNPVFHERTKHIEVDCHSIRDEFVNGNIAPRHVGTTSQLADILTKPLGRDGFAVFRHKLGIRNLYAPT